MMRYNVSSLASAILVVVLSAGASAAQGLSGNGQWQSAAGDAMRGTWSVNLAQSGSALNGTLTLTGSNVLTGGNVAGSFDGQQVTLGVLDDGVTYATFSGTLANGTISGQWQCPAIKDSGVWSGTLQTVQTQPTASANGAGPQ